MRVKKIKAITVYTDKCTGCRSCEAICSAFHASPKYGAANPKKARIRVLSEYSTDAYLPVYAGQHVRVECVGRDRYTIDGKEYEECAFCRAACPSRAAFKEPDSSLPLNCDMCESDSELQEPLCVTWCLNDALVYEERQERLEDEQEKELETGMEALTKKFGLEKVMDAVARMAKKG
jgi:benzoyl-CoA reductase subunit BamC